MGAINNTLSNHSDASRVLGSHLLVTHIIPEQKKGKKKKIHSHRKYFYFLGSVSHILTEWGQSNLIYGDKNLLSQQSITDYILKNGYTLFHNALIMAR